MSGRPERAPAWTAQEAERHLLARERFGMRFGLDRMHRLMNVLGMPRVPYPSVHVVGTNGKSSTTRMIAALLERHGLRTGAFTSPHLLSYRERIRIGERDIEPATFGAAVSHAVAAADLVDRAAAQAGDDVTQFELLTACALVEFAAAGVDVAVLEAGLGGRYDATNIVDSRVAVLTNVGLEHTRYLGPTVRHIAIEKLDVVRAGATLVLGSGLDPAARAVAQATARERGATLVQAPAALDVELLADTAVASAFLGRELDADAVAAAAAAVVVPGRFEVHPGAPVVVFDGAHNDGGIEALAESLPSFLHGRRLVVVVSILDDKDAAGMLRGLLGQTDTLVCTAAHSPRALPAATLASLAGQLGDATAVIEPDPHAALERARTLAGPEGVVLATGSIYLVADLLRPPGASGGSIL